MTSIPWLHWDLTHFPGYDQSLSRLYLTVLNFELWTLALYSLVFATTVFSCHPFGCAHPFPLLIAELLQFILQVINQILCTFHDFFFFTTSKAHLSYCIFTLYYYFILISSSFFIFPSFFLSNLLSYLVYACEEYEWFYSSFPKSSHTLFCTQSKKYQPLCSL